MPQTPVEEHRRSRVPVIPQNPLPTYPSSWDLFTTDFAVPRKGHTDVAPVLPHSTSLTGVRAQHVPRGAPNTVLCVYLH